MHFHKVMASADETCFLQSDPLFIDDNARVDGVAKNNNSTSYKPVLSKASLRHYKSFFLIILLMTEEIGFHFCSFTVIQNVSQNYHRVIFKILSNQDFLNLQGFIDLT